MKPLLASLSLYGLLSAPLLVACTGGERANSGQCPAGEVCSSETPRGLHFVGNAMADQLLSTAFGPAATAVGGTQDIALEWDRGDGVLVAFTLPYHADDDGALGVGVETTNGSVVTVSGRGSRKNYLRITDPSVDELYDRYELAGAGIKTISVLGTEFETLPPGNPQIVWAAGDQTLVVALEGEVQSGSSPRIERLVDTSMELTIANSERKAWDTFRLPSATPGVVPLTVTAGDKPTATLDVEIVDGATSMNVLGSAPAVQAGMTTSVCFAAMNGQRYVYGLPWTFVVDGQTITHGKTALNRNCIRVDASTHTSGSIPVMASAGGRSASVSVLVNAAPRSTEPVVPPKAGYLLRTESTAGERASL